MVRPKDPDPQVRRRILEVALELFAEKGFDATGVAEIVGRAGVTKGALYHYFSSKDEILFEIYRGVFSREQEDLRSIVQAHLSPTEALHKIVVDLVVRTAESAKESAVFARGAHTQSAQWAELEGQWREYQDTVRAVIEEGQRTGEFSMVASPQVVSWAIFGFTNTQHTWFDGSGPRSASEIGAELADLVIAGLRP